MLRTLPALALATLAFTPHTAAQSLSLDKSGGGVGASVSFQLQGPPTSLYLLLFSLFEQNTPVPALGITLDISDQFAGPSMSIPGFFGNLDGAGAASASLAIPNDPGFHGLRVPFQAIGQFNGSPYYVSNLVRVTVQNIGTFAPSLTQPTVPIVGGTFANAPDGGVLFAGGSGPLAQLYKSRTEEWVQAGATFGVGLLSQSTSLADGRVLFTGGMDATTGQPTSAAAIYDPVAQTTTNLTMNVARAGHGASLMGNGRVLVTGGYSALDLQNPLSLLTGMIVSTEIFDPLTNTFTPGPNMLEARALHTSTTLTSGQVLIAGGLSVLPIINLPNVSNTAYRFNPATNSFGFPSTFSGGRFFHSAAAMSNGKVLLVGGVNLDLSVFLTTLNPLDIIIGTRTDCQLYTPGISTFGTFATVNGMQEGRAGAAVAPLPNGGALIAGGFQLGLNNQSQTFAFNPTASADRFAQGPNVITPTGSMAAPRLFPVAAPLPDGTVMVVGGGPAQTEIYQY
jgi:hypothetical protein